MIWANSTIDMAANPTILQYYSTWEAWQGSVRTSAPPLHAMSPGHGRGGNPVHSARQTCGGGFLFLTVWQSFLGQFQFPTIPTTIFERVTPVSARARCQPTTETTLGKLSVAQDTAGFFNLPICNVLDLRSFPSGAKGMGSWALLFFPLFFGSCLPTFRRRSLPDLFPLHNTLPLHRYLLLLLLLLLFRHTRKALRK